jgi:hypothetical protein
MIMVIDTDDLIVDEKPATLAAAADPTCPKCAGTGAFYNPKKRAVVSCDCAEDSYFGGQE